MKDTISFSIDSEAEDRTTSEDDFNPNSTRVFELNGSSFLVSNKQIATIKIQQSESQELAETVSQLQGPITVISTHNETEVDSRWLEACLGKMMASDDVFEKAFASTVTFLSVSGELTSISEDAKSFLRDWNIKTLFYSTSLPQIRSGPYFISTSKIYQVYKLCPDPCGAFMYGVLPCSVDQSKYFRAPTQGIPVPSRLYSGPPTPSKPLLGMRLAVKDICDVYGLETSASCRAFESYYGKAETTASSIAKLLELGAVLVGKTKTAQFASGERAVDWIDYQCPFNPRGDGYFEPDCSSTGSAAAVAAYDWLDCSVGSDTLGSIAGPAAVQGIYGIRPTHGSLSLQGILPVSSVLDTLGFFTRSMHEFLELTNAWYSEVRKAQLLEARPTKLLVPKSSFDAFPESKLVIIDGFIQDFEKTFSLERSDFDVSRRWEQACPPGTPDFKDFLYSTVANIQLRDCFLNNSSFREQYERKHGHRPYVNPMIRYKWDLGAKITDEGYEESCRRKAMFAEFLKENVFEEKTVMLLPGGRPELQYRDEYATISEAGLKLQGYGFKDISYSVLGGLPLITFPVGQRPIQSKVTGGAVYEPVSLMILGSAGGFAHAKNLDQPSADCESIKGSESYLTELLLQVLAASGRPLAVKTGAEAFDIS